MTPQHHQITESLNYLLKNLMIMVSIYRFQETHNKVNFGYHGAVKSLRDWIHDLQLSTKAARPPKRRDATQRDIASADHFRLSSNQIIRTPAHWGDSASCDVYELFASKSTWSECRGDIASRRVASLWSAGSLTPNAHIDTFVCRISWAISFEYHPPQYRPLECCLDCRSFQLGKGHIQRCRGVHTVYSCIDRICIPSNSCNG